MLTHYAARNRVLKQLDLATVLAIKYHFAAKSILGFSVMCLQGGKTLQRR